MTIHDKIIEKALSLFDVAGADRLDGSNVLLLVGLESTRRRDLDDFGHSGDRFHMYGFEKHVAPRLDELIAFIRDTGYAAEALGRLGYPLEGEINLKEKAVRIGLGKRGKNTVILHPEYGPRLRFMGIRTDALLETPPEGKLIEERNPVCEGCSICIDVCPVKILQPYLMTDMQKCLSYVNPIDEHGHSILCDLCLKMCPAGKPEKR